MILTLNLEFISLVKHQSLNILYLFKGKPLTPNITGSLNIVVGNICQLTCLSQLTSASAYDAKLVNLSYAWFVNGTKLDNGMEQTLEVNVSKHHVYNNYSCTVRDHELESDHSNAVKINPLCEAKIFKSKNWYFK